MVSVVEDEDEQLGAEYEVVCYLVHQVQGVNSQFPQKCRKRNALLPEMKNL